MPVTPTIRPVSTKPLLCPTRLVMVPEMPRGMRWARSWPSGSSQSCGDRATYKPFEERGTGRWQSAQKARRLRGGASSAVRQGFSEEEKLELGLER